MNSDRVWTAALVVIGDEILSGRTEDRNIAQVANWLNPQGIRLTEVRVVPDVQEAIVGAVNALRPKHDYLFTTGGIGPTHDDITVDAIAAAFGVPVVVHPEARRILEDYYRDRPLGLTEARLRMARVPEGAELIPNPTSGAPGVRMDNVFILAGVPNIAKAMLEALDGKLEGGKPVVSVTVRAHAAESDVAELLKQVQDQHAGVSIGSYPFYGGGRFGADFVIRSVDGELARRCADELRRRLVERDIEVVE
jgi:molybdenum cofactor synthesis domain-containing protein